MVAPNKILEEALTLKPAQKAELIGKLLSSLDKPDSEINKLWAKEAESRDPKDSEKCMGKYFEKKGY